MNSQIKKMSVVEYFRDDRPWAVHRTDNPKWTEVEKAVRQMDNYCFPIVLLSCLELGSKEDCFDDENSFNIIGGNGRIALFHFFGEWQYVRKNGGSDEVRLWESDQGYFCEEKNIIYDIEHVLKVVKQFYESGNYEDLDNI